MNNLIKYTLPAIALCALAACSSDKDSVSGTPTTDTDNGTNGRELIAFSQEGGITRAGITRGDYDTETGFSGDTKIVMRIKAEQTNPAATRYSQAVATAGARLTGNTLASDWCYTEYGYTTPHSHLSYNAGSERYWDDAFGRKSLLTVYAVTVPDQNSDAVLASTILDSNGSGQSKVDDNTNPNWYTITGTENNKVTWTVSTKQTAETMPKEDLAYSNNIREGEGSIWGRYHQTYNSTTTNWDKSKEYGRLEWQSQDQGNAAVTVGKFDQGHLVFQHALTYLEIQLKEGTGFDNNNNTDFVWTNKPAGYDQSITLKNFPTQGDLDLSVAMNGNGMWTNTTVNDIKGLKETHSEDNVKTFTLEGYVIPGTLMDEQSTNLLEFEIDNAQYYVTGEQIAEAIKANDATKTAEAAKTMAGKHYVIKLTVGKKKIDNITAAILPWETVGSNETDAVNTHSTFTFEERETKLTEADAGKFDIYRAERNTGSYIEQGPTSSTPAYDYEWNTGYTATDSKATKSYVTNHWEATNWFWKDNKTWYHFRAAGRGDSPSGTVTITEDTTDGDYYVIENGPIDGSGAYKDWVWGAPFTYVDNSYEMTYKPANGFSLREDGTTKQIAPAIAATTHTIDMLLFHMTSQITVNLKTTHGADKVVLQDGDTKTEVKIVRFMPTGKVRMGTGKVEWDGTRNTDGVAMTNTLTTHVAAAAGVAEQLNGYTYGMVPQPLSWGTGLDDHIGLEITTPDGNKYYVRDLSTIVATTASVSTTHMKNPYTETSAGTGLWTIDTWYPHYKYTYNITLRKKGIDLITAAILPWEVVTGNNVDIDLEN